MSGTRMDESFILTKNNYEDSTKTIFKNLLKDVEFTDVTLALNDEKQVKGHKAILGASSSFFRKIFQQNAVANLVLYLKGISTKDMNSIMEFIYLGQTSVNKADLSTFLEVAEELKIEGLMQMDKAAMSASHSESVPEITIDELTIDEEESPVDEFSPADNSSSNQSTFETSSSQDSSMRDTSVTSHDVSSEMRLQVSPDILNTMLPLPVSREDQEHAAMIVANIKKNTKRPEQNTSILNGSVTFDSENKHYSCSKCVFTTVHRRSALRHFANTHSDSDQPDIKQEQMREPEEQKHDLSEVLSSDLESSLENDIQHGSEKKKKYKCSECDFSSVHRRSLRRHLHKVHGCQMFVPLTATVGPTVYHC